jgi:beta-glucosidase
MGTPAKCLPASCVHHRLTRYILNTAPFFQSGTALGATWNPELIQDIGVKLLAEEAKSRAVSIVLAPTCNIQRVSDAQMIMSHEAFSRLCLSRTLWVEG